MVFLPTFSSLDMKADYVHVHVHDHGHVDADERIAKSQRQLRPYGGGVLPSSKVNVHLLSYP